MLSKEEYAKLKAEKKIADARFSRECRILWGGLPADCLDDPAKERAWDREQAKKRREVIEDFDRWVNSPALIAWRDRETN